MVLFVSLLFFPGSRLCAQNIHDNKPIYTCKVFTMDTLRHTVRFNKSYAYWVYDMDLYLLKKGYDTSIDLKKQSGKQLYLMVKGIELEANPGEAEVRKYAYVIRP